MSISHSVNEENLVGICRKTLHLIGRIDLRKKLGVEEKDNLADTLQRLC